MGNSRLLPSSKEVTLEKPYLCGYCRQVIQTGEKAAKKQIEILGPEGEAVEVVTCYTHPGECPQKPEVVRVDRSHTCHRCRRLIKAGRQAAVWKPTGIRRKTPLYAHYPCCPSETAKEVVTLDQPQLCSKCRRIIPAGSKAEVRWGTVIAFGQLGKSTPVEVTAFSHHPSCPKYGRRVCYKKGEVSI